MPIRIGMDIPHRFHMNGLETIKALGQLTRLDRPVGTYLLLWPTLSALWLAAEGVPPFGVLLIFIVGTFVMRAAGCVINDIADRNIDPHVERTKNRPLADGRLSLTTAWAVFAVLLFLAGLVLWPLNLATKVVAIIGALIAVIYPFLKRITNLPQIALGLAFSWGIPMAAFAINEAMTASLWLFFFSNFIWVIAYDTQYAMTDRNDDLKIGVGSTAIFFGDRDNVYLRYMHGAIIVLLVVVGFTSSLGIFYYLSLFFAAGLFVYQAHLTRHRVPDQCFKAFLNNAHVGLVLLVGILSGVHVPWP